MKKMLIKLLSFILSEEIKGKKKIIERLNNEKNSLEKKINKLKDEYTTYEDYSEFGMPTKFYDFETSQEYKECMAEIVKEQKK